MFKTDIRGVLINRPEGNNLVHRIEIIKREVTPLLETIRDNFPEYTPHDITHSEIVLKRVNELIPDTLKEKLETYEIYFLIISAYLHDLGMADLDPSDIPGDIIYDIRKKRAYIRGFHNERSEKYIINQYKKLKIPDIQQARIIGRICRGHRNELLDNINKFDPKQTYKNQIINVPMLASILRVSDELDLTFERIKLIAYELGLISEPVSKFEWERHLAVDGITKDPDDPMIFRSTATCREPKIHRALKEIEYKVNCQLEDLHNNLYHYKKYSRDFPRKFKLVINAEGYKYYDFKFSLKENEILNLLIGEGLYKRKEESIRELLKNCLDACRLNSILLKEATESGFIYKPKITFILTLEKDKLIIEDNGIGMDEYIIDNYFTKIGRSFYRSSDFLEKEYGFSPVSELGIGFLSCFMIANKAVIETKTAESDPLLIEIDSISSYFLVKQGNRKYPGTNITLHLKDNSKEINVKNELEYFARHIEVPINIKLSPNEEYTIESCKGKYEPFFKSGSLGNKLYILKGKIKNDLFIGVIGILLEKHENKISLMKSWQYIDMKLYKKSYAKYGNGLTISNNGILISDGINIPVWLNRDKVFLDIDISGNCLDLTLGRSSIIQNKRFNDFMESLESKIINYFVSLFNRLDIHKGEEMNNFILYVTEPHLSYYYKSTPIRVDELIQNDIVLSNFFIKYYSFKCFSERGFCSQGYKEIKKSNKIIKLINCWDYNNDYIYDVLYKCGGFDDNLYVMLETHDSINLLIKHVLDCSESINFYDLFVMAKESEIDDLLPSEVNIMKFCNYDTDILITHILEGDEGFVIFVNSNNRFINLIKKYRKEIYANNRNLVKELFRYIKWENGPDIKRVLYEQEIILNWLRDSNLIEDNEFEHYRFTDDDFAGSFFE